MDLFSEFSVEVGVHTFSGQVARKPISERSRCNSSFKVPMTRRKNLIKEGEGEVVRSPLRTSPLLWYLAGAMERRRATEQEQDEEESSILIRKK